MPLIYVIDDSPTDRSLLVRFLKRHVSDAEIICEEDGYRALARLEELAVKPDLPLPALVILDQRMPRLNGSELVQRLRLLPRLKAIPFVLFSSSVLEEEVVECLGSGCASYVRKPLDFAEFERVVRAIADYWLTIHAHDLFPAPRSTRP